MVKTLVYDINVGDYLNVKCSRSKLFYWMHSDGFDGRVLDVDRENCQYIKIEVSTEPVPSRFQRQTFWINILSPDVTAIEKLR